jgi:ribosome-associated translation inhibitor RaiA
MNANTMVCFRNVEKTERVAQLIEARARKLTRLHPRVTRCRVVVERPHANHQHGDELSALVHAVAPGAEAIGRARAAIIGDDGVVAAVAEAFRAVERQLAGRSPRPVSGQRRPARQELGDAA